MRLLRTDPGAFAATVDGRVYPVRDGVFAVRDNVNPEAIVGFEEAFGVSDAVVAELVALGSSEADYVEESPATAGAPAPAGAKVDLRPLQAGLLAAHEKADAAHERISQLEGRLAALGAGGEAAAEDGADGDDGDDVSGADGDGQPDGDGAQQKKPRERSRAKK